MSKLRTFLTEWKNDEDGKTYDDEIRAETWELAESYAEFRRTGEKVIGEKVCEIYFDFN